MAMETEEERHERVTKEIIKDYLEDCRLQIYLGQDEIEIELFAPDGQRLLSTEGHHSLGDTSEY